MTGAEGNVSVDIPAAINKVIRREKKRYLVFPKYGLAYAPIPKAANSSVKAVLARKLKLQPDGHEDMHPTQTRYWVALPNEDAVMLTKTAYIRDRGRHKLWGFSVVREPLSRLYSAWNNKVIENKGPVSPEFSAMGVEKGMPLEAFVDCVAGHGDDEVDVHVAAQHSILCHDGALLPDLVLRMERLQEEWPILRSQARMHTGLLIPPPKVLNSRGNARPKIAERLPDALVEKIVNRYRPDYERFYPKVLRRFETAG